MDWHRVHAILDLVQDDEVIDSLQTSEECDVVQQSDHNSDTEVELISDIDDDYVDCKNGYVSKDKTVMAKDPRASRSNSNVNTRQPLQLRKRKATDVKHCPRPQHAWQLLFTDDILELIVESTNEKILKRGHGYSNSISVEDIKAFFGMLYLHGIMRPTHQKRSDLWHEKYGISIVRNTMKHERFNFILQNISFDKEDDEEAMMQYDTMKRMRKFFEIFAMNCRTVFEVEKMAVVDEVVVPLYGPCPFRYDIDKKPLKLGMKLVLLVDPDNFFISNLDVITDPYFGPEEIVKKLVQHLAGTGKTIIMDSWYTSCSLMEKLKNEYQLYSIAALNPSDEVIPPLFLSRLRKCRTFMTGFLDNETALTSYVTSHEKSVNVLTNHPNFYKRGHANHTTPVSVYKKNQSAVEVVDVLMHYYTTMQCSNDWTLSLLFTLLNIASVNAQVLFSVQSSTNVTQRRLFIRDLAFGLIGNECKPRNPDPDMLLVDSAKRKLQMYAKDFKSLGSFQLDDPRKGCRICSKVFKRRNRKTRTFCYKCSQPMCREHTASICIMCCDL